MTRAVQMEGGETAKLEWLGCPAAQVYRGSNRVYARNPWDLQAFDGSLYIGGGNSSNLGLAQNAGPVSIISFHPKTGDITEEVWVDDEQIDRFRVLNEALYIPGHDPQESWDRGNFYILSGNR